MDDISFFESFEYSHRGGIWADASRHERSSGLYPSASPDENTEEVQSSVSAPTLDTSTSIDREPEPLGMERSHSAPIDSRVEDENSQDLLTTSTLPRAQTVTGTSAPSNTSARRRTWFSTQSDDTASAKTDGEATSDPIERGRTSEIHRHLSSGSTGTITKPDNDGTQPASEDEGIDVTATKRSVSQHSHTSSLSPPSQGTTTPPPSEPSTSTSQQDSLFAGFRSKSPGLSTQQKPSSSPTNNFFQTLKSRDKQAISNTAKEAIRKWGVGWGSLKKEQPLGTSDDGASDNESQREAEDKVHKPKPSYAEVRAAVEQRRGALNSDNLLRPDSVPSKPVAIAKAPHKERTASFSSSVHSQQDSISPSSSARSDDPITDNLPQARSVSPGPSVLSPPKLPPRVRSVSHHSQNGAETVMPPASDEDELPARVIQAQPSAPKAMTIPGIHAKHRGEVMSMGYAPPPPPSEPRKPSAIPSVYRLWKSSSNQSSGESQPETQSGFAGTDQDGPTAPGPSSDIPTPTPGPALPPRPAPPQLVPPPLPPRSTSTNAVQVTSEPPRHPPEVGKTSPPASASLQRIVSREGKRNSLDMSTRSGSPGRPAVAIDEQTDSMDDPPTNDAPEVTETVPKPTPPALPPRRSQVAK
jgi:hypothetical protein